MKQGYTEEDKAKYCRGFKNCTLPIADYAEKMGIEVEKLKEWLKEYKEPKPYGEINLAALLSEPKKENKKSSFNFNASGITIEIKEDYDKAILKQVLELLVVTSYVK